MKHTGGWFQCEALLPDGTQVTVAAVGMPPDVMLLEVRDPGSDAEILGCLSEGARGALHRQVLTAMEAEISAALEEGAHVGRL